MVDSTVAKKDAENWIRNEFLFKKYHLVFAKRKLGVQSGAEFECDAVSEDGNSLFHINKCKYNNWREPWPYKNPRSYFLGSVAQ